MIRSLYIDSLRNSLCFLVILGTILGVFAISSSPMSANAQINQSGVVDNLTIRTVPKYPGPFETVTMVVEDYSQDLNKIDIAWTLNGKVEKRGIGSKQFQFKTSGLGTVSNLSINIGGEVRTIAIRPTKVDLIWQADTFTPPFYLGKALHSNQDPITVVALPFFVNSQGSRLNPDTLIYKWKNNDKLDNSASGYGKKTFKITPSILLKPINIEVEVSSDDGSFMSINSIAIPDSRTETVLYENHPLLGIMFGNALNNKDFELADKEVSIIAAPYFFSNQQKKFGGVSYNWSLNNSTLSQQGNEVIFRKPEGVSTGRSLISVSTKNLERFMQASDATLNVIFKETESTTSDQTTF